MTPTHPTPRPSLTSRSGFSLIELLVVIIVIAILLAVLLPGLTGVQQRVREASVVTDIKNLDTAIVNFKTVYGMDPPSSFSIYEDGQWDTSILLDRNSLALIRQLWPQMTFTAGAGTILLADAAPFDINGNGNTTEDFILNGSECLAFFLGGTFADPGTTPRVFAPQGFSSNPANPFAAGGASRKGPFYGDMDTTRFVDVNANGMPELLDTLPNQTSPYLYFSSYDGRGYQPFGYDGLPNTADDEMPLLPAPTTLYVEESDSIVYRLNNLTGVALDPKPQPINPKTYQIISAGYDYEYFGSTPGAAMTERRGGMWSNEATFQFTGPRFAERDNITNFSNGRLD